MRTATSFIAFFILLYQKTVSPDHGIFFYSSSRCRFFPSCSAYSTASLRQYGLLKGGVLSLARIVRCGPWSAGGYDPIVGNLKSQAPNIK